MYQYPTELLAVLTDISASLRTLATHFAPDEADLDSPTEAQEQVLVIMPTVALTATPDESRQTPVSGE